MAGGVNVVELSTASSRAWYIGETRPDQTRPDQNKTKQNNDATNN